MSFSGKQKRNLFEAAVRRKARQAEDEKAAGSSSGQQAVPSAPASDPTSGQAGPSRHYDRPAAAASGSMPAGLSTCEPPSSNASRLTTDQIVHDHLFGGLLPPRPHPAAARADPAPPQPDPGSPDNPITGLGPNYLKRTVLTRDEGVVNDDLFDSPPKAKPAEEAPAKAAKKQRQRAPKAAKDPLYAATERPHPHQSAARRADPTPSEPPRGVAAAPKPGAAVAVPEVAVAGAASAVVDPELAAAQPGAASSTRVAAEGEGEPLVLQSEGGLRLQVPASITSFLRPYQRTGVEFLFRQYSLDMGGILADDMGLGKTVQTIAFCAALLGKTGTFADNTIRSSVAGKKRFPILILAPPSVLDNWEREFQTWGTFSTCMYAGRSKKPALRGIDNGTHEIMLAGLESFRTDHKALLEIPWHAVIIDEAHKLKNHMSKLYQAVEQLGTKIRLLLTGTPMQNDHDEMWNIFDIAVPGCLGERQQFKEFYANPLKKARSISANDHTIEEGQDRQRRLDAVVKRYMLRRRKDNTISEQLPTKTDNIVFCQLTEFQLRAYKRFLATPEMLQLGASFDLCTCGSGLRGGECCYVGPAAERGPLWEQFHNCQCDNAYHELHNPDGCKWHKPDGCPGPRPQCMMCLILPALTILKKISNHLDLIKADPESCGNDAHKLDRQYNVAEMILGEDAHALGGTLINKRWLDLDDTRPSGKLRVLEKLLDAWNGYGNDNKVLLFSTSTKMLDRIETLVTLKGITFSRLDGKTDRMDRQKMVDSFNGSASAFLFLISTLAGGVGLNLQSANKVVIMDPSWNPAQDLQAIDRAYRLGSKRDVNVYRLISSGTLEEIVYSRQLYKQQQSNIAIENAQEPRYFDAIQGDRGKGALAKGELFGCENLLKLTSQTINTVNIVSTQAHEPELFRIEQVDSDELAEMGVGPDAGGGGGVAAEMEEGVDDRGLGDLARHLVQGGPGEGDARSQRYRNDTAQEAEALQAAGVTTWLKHDQLLGPKQGGRSRTPASGSQRSRGARSPLKVEAASSAPPPVASSPPRMNVLEALASWQLLSVREMAVRLRGMTLEERTRLRQQYAEEHM